MIFLISFCNTIKQNTYQIWKLLKISTVMWYIPKIMTEDQSLSRMIWSYLTSSYLLKLHLKIKMFSKIMSLNMMRSLLLLSRYSNKFVALNKISRKDKVGFHWRSLRTLLFLTWFWWNMSYWSVYRTIQNTMVIHKTMLSKRYFLNWATTKIITRQ